MADLTLGDREIHQGVVLSESLTQNLNTEIINMIPVESEGLERGGLLESISKTLVERGVSLESLNPTPGQHVE
eukprot:CAMPEP_0117440448 /NCGR_PEP_ID=MMETSP0759-20121206/3103_1 /TAXON_ID=63605 /ORGANISM="Percolomonas cosmopolitus, Strain WS" /LENGTH=72 /DNA_ID=CAMNT_0005232229 /DNA_START=408 /DNA_END=626 /DNA_ORIENTATION=-